MDSRMLSQLTSSRRISIAEAMRNIDANSGGILALLDDSGKLVGTITDGDIRRFLLAGGSIEETADKAANARPRFARNLEEAEALYHRKNYAAIPIVDENGVVVDVYLGERTERKAYEPICLPVVINAGGRGTRLFPLTKIFPKPLIPVGDMPIIEHIMREYQRYECNRFHVIVNYKRELMKAYFSECERKYDISWHDERKPLGTGGGLSLLKGRLKDTFFFTNCDSLLTADYADMLRFHRENDNVITMVCAHRNFQIPYGVVDMGLNGRIERMREKPFLSFLTNTGVYIVEPEALDDMEEGVPIGFPEVAERQLRKGRKVAAYPIRESEWMDMGQFEELEKMRRKLYGE